MRLSELSERDCFLLHINHAGILIKYQGHYLLCDPWYVSPAFNNWTQDPAPPAELVDFVIGLDPADLSVVISHGHDDHLDDYFVEHHLRASQFFVPEFRRPALQDRVERLTGRAPTLLSDVPSDGPHGFRLSRIINEEFTSFDAIITIETDDFTVVHANDNWHAQPPAVLARLKRLQQSANGKFFYFSQFGIADCFPLCYPQYSDAELSNVALKRLQSNIAAADANMRSLDLSTAFSYANHSRIVSEFAKPKFQGFDVATKMVNEYNTSEAGAVIIQLMPGTYIDLSERPGVLLTLDGLRNEAFIDQLMDKFERKANEYIGRLEPGPVSFAFAEEISLSSVVEPGVIYATSRIIWQRILTGLLNIETISIGGGGIIVKTPRDFNIHHVHQKIGNFGYIAQAKFKTDGLRWLYTEG